MRERATRPVAHPSRDQGESAFTAILAGLVARVPGARAAALVDFQGETVDYAGCAVPFDLRVAAAHWRIVLDQAEGLRSLGSSMWLATRFARTGYLVHGLPERYALVVVFGRAAGLAGWHRAIAVCIRALSEEAKWRRTTTSEAQWFSVEVTSDRQGRPKSVEVAGRVRPVEVIGVVVNDGFTAGSTGAGDLATRGRGWRVRFDSGAEATLVREPGGVWYVDAAIEGAAPGRRPRKRRSQSR